MEGWSTLTPNPPSLQSTLTPNPPSLHWSESGLGWKMIWSEGGSRARSQSARALFSLFFSFYIFVSNEEERHEKRSERRIINYKLNGKNSENQTVQINKNARPHMPEGKIIEKVRAWAVLVRRPEDSYHKRFLSHSSYFAFQHFSHLSHFEKNRILKKSQLLHFRRMRKNRIAFASY